MKQKREIYQKYIHKKIKIIIMVFLIVCLIMFSIVIFDSFKYNLPFYYILFLIPGIVFSFFYKKTQKIIWHKEKNKIIAEMDFIGIILILVLISIRLELFPFILTSTNTVYITDAILIITIGIFLGRVNIIWKEIKKIFFKKTLEKITSKDSNK